MDRFMEIGGKSMSKLIDYVSALVRENETIFLSEEDTNELALVFKSNSDLTASLDLREQSELLGLCMRNFGVFVVTTVTSGQFPDPLRFSLISKLLYSTGSCDLPADLNRGDFDQVFSSHDETWWGRDDTDETIYNFRESLSSSPVIGLEPLAGYFSQIQTDASLLYCMLQNPILPKAWKQRVADRNHPIFENLEDEEADFLVEHAIESLNG
jgi:hypothetical protein